MFRNHAMFPWLIGPINAGKGVFFFPRNVYINFLQNSTHSTLIVQGFLVGITICTFTLVLHSVSERHAEHEEMSSPYNHLSPLAMGDLRLKNCVVMASLTRNRDNVPGKAFTCLTIKNGRILD